MVTLNREAVISGLRAAARIRAGVMPTESELTSAHKMESWGLEPVGGGLHRLIGVVSGHPEVPDGFCHTSVVLVLAEDLQWARTVSRVYSLGRPFEEMLNKARPLP